MKTWTAVWVRSVVWYCLLRFAVLPNFMEATEWKFFLLMSGVILCEATAQFFGELTDHLLGATLKEERSACRHREMMAAWIDSPGPKGRIVIREDGAFSVIPEEAE
jgi:hypothetical protein